MPAPFRDCTTPTPVGDAFTVRLGEDWRQGPGVYGGMTAAALLRACRARLGASAMPLRSMALQYVAPVAPGTSEIEVDLDRTGTGTAFLVARLRQQGKVGVHALATFGRGRAADLDEDRLVRPDVPGPDTTTDLPYLPGLMPVFAQHLAFRYVGGAAPYQGADTARIGLWMRFRAPPPALDESDLVGLLDAAPPAVLCRATAPRPASTVTFQLHLLRPVPPDPAAWWYLDARSRVTAEGWSDEELTLFSADGRAVAIGRQLVAVIR